MINYKTILINGIYWTTIHRLTLLSSLELMIDNDLIESSSLFAAPNYFVVVHRLISHY